MKKTVLSLLLFCALLLGAARAEVELFAVSVGKGDALILRAGGYTCLIDTGKNAAQDQIEAAFAALGVDRLDAVFITHTDKDHVGGLKWLKKGALPIDAIYAPAIHPEVSDDKHPAAKAAKKLGLSVSWLRVGDTIALGDSGSALTVLAPELSFPDNADDNSLVMLLDGPDGRVLLTGDMELAEEAALLSSGQDLHCDVLKLPNHGDDDASGPGLIAACGADIALISTSGAEKPGTPDPDLLRALEAAGADVYVTENCTLGVRVTLSAGQVSAEYVQA